MEVAGNVANVNGGIELDRAHVGGGLETTNGDIDRRRRLACRRRHPGPEAHGQLVLAQHKRKPKIVIGPGAVVEGSLRFEHEVELYVSDSAKIGPVEGAKAITFSGDRP